jgi:proline iminopeptidase
MDPEHLRAMSEQLPQGEYLLCPEGSHLALYDDQRNYMEGLIGWLHRLGPSR